MPNNKIILIGDIVVDVTLKTQNHNLKLRMGGIIHAARGLWALNIPYDIGYFAPSYLDEQIKNYLNDIGCSEIFKLGDVVGAPYLFLIQEAKEVGNQGYEFLLRDMIQINYLTEGLEKINNNKYEDCILISGNYDQTKIIASLDGDIHIDVTNNTNDFNFFKNINRKVSTVFISTSSTIFKTYFNDNFKSFAEEFKIYCDKIILKENRGGSRGIDFKTGEIFNASSQTTPILHSIGVGDVFDTCYVIKQKSIANNEALEFSSWVAHEYALTTFPNDFKINISRIININVSDLMKMGGVSLPWENRKQINIYIAAPDFEDIDTSYIEVVEKSLIYHNFSPRRPIKENGLMEPKATKARKQDLFNKDINLLGQCSILIAVLLYNDPGTLIEIGLAAERGMPIFVYDPYSQAENCMLTELPNLVSNELDEIISEVFIVSSKLKI